MEIVTNEVEPIQIVNYKRKTEDSVQVKGNVLRGLFLFVKILTTSFVRDILFGRFLKARQELLLKSCISREITLDSKIG
jgi:hypothetical protein